MGSRGGRGTTQGATAATLTDSARPAGAARRAPGWRRCWRGIGWSAARGDANRHRCTRASRDR
eukprot:1307814-Pyramimonas_sp.AAC.1